MGQLQCGLNSYTVFFKAFPISQTRSVSNGAGQEGDLLGLCALLTGDQAGPQMS